MPRKAKSVPVVIPEPTNLEARIARDTKDWIRTAADERAALAGFAFDGERGIYVCNWMEQNCYLYEGIGAKLPIVLMPYQREFVMRLYSWVYYSDDWKEWIRRFNRATLIVPKKSGKSPLLAANGLYLCCADGEEGQKVFTSAKNGKQALITQTHAVLMVRQSPALRDPVCVINKTTNQITHTPTRSCMVILTGDDTRGAQQNEGINGSVLIDELHVFDREMHTRTKGAGISRKEPLNLAVSTAGDDPSSYGFERVKYGRDVNRGAALDPHALHVEYAAPQDASDEDIAANLEAYATACNPALGYTVRLSELKSDYETSKGKPVEMASFKQYRLDIWVGSKHPWLNIANWNACQRDYGPAFLAGRNAALGLDLSRTRDMTAAVLNFLIDDDGNPTRYLWPMFWLPRKTADARRNLFPYFEWEEKGYLTLTDGNVVDYAAVRSDIVSFVQANGITVDGIFFDQHYAEEMTQALADELGCDRTAVSQTLMTLSPLSKEFERGIDAGLVAHPGNAVLDWQIGHVEIIKDTNQNTRPVKPDPNSGKSIDGIMAILDTYAGAIDELAGGASDGGPSVSFF